MKQALDKASFPPVPEVLRELGVDVLRGNVARCIRAGHSDSSPSMKVYRDHVHCYGCGWSGDALDVVREVLDVDFKGALAHFGVDRAKYVEKRAERMTERSPGDVPKGRVDVSRAVWRITEGDPLSTEAKDWLTSRGLDPAVAHRLGCRDWFPVLGDVSDALGSFSEAELAAAGFLGEKGRWWPLDSLLRGYKDMRGLAVPVFVPEHDHPIAWRWRLFKPIKRADGSVLKTCRQPAQPGDGPRWYQPPLGLQALSGRDVVIVAEGEPDWLSFAQEAGDRAAVIGVCEVAAGWRPTWTRYVAERRRVVALVHDGKGGEHLVATLAEEIGRRLGVIEAEKRFVWKCLPEKEDANDLLRAGRLKPWVEAALG